MKVTELLYLIENLRYILLSEHMYFPALSPFLSNWVTYQDSILIWLSGASKKPTCRRLVLKFALATTNTHKQSTVTFEVFVLWLHNQHYYTRGVIGIKMTYRDFPYYEGIRAKTHHEHKLHENKHENHTNLLHTFRKRSITWSQFVISVRSKLWLIHYSMRAQPYTV